ncbi:NAD(+) synthase [Halosegnis marinus]|uniref:NAD(+) synthase n=1 Tax=Halosegnis marinus TaxID=3034023 RepID=UPI00360B4FE6
MADLGASLVGFVETAVAEADAERAVVALDGGVESAVVATLAADALGPDRVTALVMPAHLSSEAPARDAEAVAAGLGLEAERVHLGPMLAAFREVMGETGAPADDVVAVSNALSRFRMACAYYLANTSNGVVFGTATRTDRLLGAVAKHGDVGADFLPLGDRYYTEVRALAHELALPDAVVAGPRGGFAVGPTDAETLGVPERTLDELLVALVDADLSPAAAAERAGVSVEAAERVASWRAATAHKRRLPPTPATYGG